MAPPGAINDVSDLKRLAIKLGTEGPHKTLPTSRLIQVLFNGVYIIKTTAAVYVWEHPYYPQLYIPSHIIQAYCDARSADLTITPGETYHADDSDTDSDTKNRTPLATHWTLRVRDLTLHHILAFAPTSPLPNLVRLDFAEPDQWFEESTPIFVHPKDPFKRIDVLQSTRHVVVRVAGRVVADSDCSAHLYETGLPCRYYLPRTCVDASVLRRSPTRSLCPYKGEAEYYHVEIGGRVWEDIVWFYNRPLLECAKIEGLVCFYNEHVQIEVDGEPLETPVTPFSHRGGTRSVQPESEPEPELRKDGDSPQVREVRLSTGL